MTPTTEPRLVRGDHPRVKAFMANHHFLITPEQARDLGVSTPYIKHMLRTGAWIVLRRGVYVDAEHWRSLDPWHGRPLLLARAAVLAMRRGWVLSHCSAAHALGLDVLVEPGVEPTDVHITRPGDAHAWTAHGVSHHLARFGPDDVVVVDGLRVLGPARTVVDVARYHGVRAGLVTACSALRLGLVTKADLWNVADGMVSWPYITDVRTVIELASEKASTAIEALGIEFLTELGVGPIDLQWPLQRRDGRVAWCDARINCHVFEMNGKVKLLSVAQGGVAEQPATEVVWEARKRERDVTVEGLGLSNLYYADFFGAARTAALLRARAEYQQTVERWGVELPAHLERNAQEIRARLERPDAS